PDPGPAAGVAGGPVIGRDGGARRRLPGRGGVRGGAGLGGLPGGGGGAGRAGRGPRGGAGGAGGGGRVRGAARSPPVGARPRGVGVGAGGWVGAGGGGGAGGLPVLRVGGVLAAAGGLVVVLAPVPAVAVAGWAVAGLGLAGVVPLLFSAAANLGGTAPGDGPAA